MDKMHIIREIWNDARHLLRLLTHNGQAEEKTVAQFLAVIKDDVTRAFAKDGFEIVWGTPQVGGVNAQSRNLSQRDTSLEKTLPDQKTDQSEAGSMVTSTLDLLISSLDPEHASAPPEHVRMMINNGDMECRITCVSVSWNGTASSQNSYSCDGSLDRILLIPSLAKNLRNSVMEIIYYAHQDCLDSGLERSNIKTKSGAEVPGASSGCQFG